jgi:hypothetical protein
MKTDDPTLLLHSAQLDKIQSPNAFLSASLLRCVLRVTSNLLFGHHIDHYIRILHTKITFAFLSSRCLLRRFYFTAQGYLENRSLIYTSQQYTILYHPFSHLTIYRITSTRCRLKAMNVKHGNNNWLLDFVHRLVFQR